MTQRLPHFALEQSAHALLPPTRHRLIRRNLARGNGPLDTGARRAGAERVASQNQVAATIAELLGFNWQRRRAEAGSALRFVPARGSARSECQGGLISEQTGGTNNAASVLLGFATNAWFSRPHRWHRRPIQSGLRRMITPATTRP